VTEGMCPPTPPGPPTFPNPIFLNIAPAPLGGGSSIPGSPAPPHCNVSATAAPFDCFDSGAILLVEHVTAAPEPSSLFLLGAGLVAAAAYGRRRTRRKY